MIGGDNGHHVRAVAKLCEPASQSVDGCVGCRNLFVVTLLVQAQIVGRSREQPLRYRPEVWYALRRSLEFEHVISPHRRHVGAVRFHDMHPEEHRSSVRTVDRTQCFIDKPVGGGEVGAGKKPENVESLRESECLDEEWIRGEAERPVS